MPEGKLNKLKMDKRITIQEFVSKFSKTKDQLTTIMSNRLKMLMYGETSAFHPERNKITPLIYLDEVTMEIYLSVTGAGKKSWSKFCNYRDSFIK